MKKSQLLYKLLLLCLLGLTFTPQTHAAEITDPNQILRQNTFGAHRETVEDMRVKALGSDIRHTRSWNSGKWYFNRRWENLRIVLKDSTITTNSNITIYRGAAKYDYKSNGIYAHETDISQTIITTSSGYRWQDRKGNRINYDNNRRAINYTNANDVTVRFQYNAQNKLTGIFDHNNKQIFWYEYKLDGQLSQVKDYSGRTVQYHYNNADLTQVIDVRGNTSTYTYKEGRLETKTDAQGRVTQIEYTVTGLVKSINTAGISRLVELSYDKVHGIYHRREKYSNGKTIHKRYDSKGDFIGKSINGVSTRNIVTTNNGLTRTNTDRAGNRSISTYDEWDKLLGITHTDGSKTSTTYEHVFSKAIKQINENGVITLKEYDTKGNLTKLTEAAGLPEQRITAYTYDAYGNQLSKTIAADAVSVAVTTSATFDAYGNQLTTTDGEGHITQYSYDVLGNVLSRTDPLDNVWTYTYDASGNQTSKTDPLNNTTLYEYDKVNNLIKMTDALNRITQYEYDDRNNPIAETNALNQKTSYQYNSEDKLIQSTDAANKTTYVTYNLDSRPIENKDGNANIIRFEYITGKINGSGQPGKIIYPTYTESRIYDNRGRLTEKTQHLDESTTLTTQYRYDKVGNRTVITDAKGRQSRHVYDAHNRLVETIDPLNGTTKTSYDNRNNLITVTNANTGITQYSYDKNNRKTKEIKPLGETTSYFYDTVGRQTAVIDANNHKRVLEYDASGRNTSTKSYNNTNDSAAIKTVSYQYDKVNNLLGYNDNTSSANYSYDKLNRLLNTNINYSNFSKNFTYSYDASGNKASFTSVDGIKNTYSYNNANQLSAIKIPNIGQINLGNYLWTRPRFIRLPGGQTQYYRYDPLMRITGIELKDPAQNSQLKYHYHYDKANNIIQKQTEHGNYQYSYDELDRLTTVNNPTLNDEAYSYDALGNRLTDNSIIGNWDYNLNNQLSTKGTDTTYTYNDNGSLIKTVDSTKNREFIYNADNRLTNITENATTIASYQYDPFGRRIAKHSNGQTTWYIYAQEGLIAETDQNGAVLKQYGWRPNSTWGTNPVYLKENAKYYFYQNDHLGTPKKLLNQSGLVVWSASYESFGKAEIEIESVVNNLRFPGQYYDGESGLHYNYFRDYDPSIGRYVKSDPIGLDGGLNIYIYAWNTPMMLIDPYGEHPMLRFVYEFGCEYALQQWRKQENIELKKIGQNIAEIREIRESNFQKRLTICVNNFHNCMKGSCPNRNACQSRFNSCQEKALSTRNTHNRNLDAQKRVREKAVRDRFSLGFNCVPSPRK